MPVVLQGPAFSLSTGVAQVRQDWVGSNNPHCIINNTSATIFTMHCTKDMTLKELKTNLGTNNTVTDHAKPSAKHTGTVKMSG